MNLNLQKMTVFDIYVKTCSMGNDVTLMDKWYRKDTNKVRNEKEGNPLYERGNTHLLMSLIFANLNTRPTPRKKYCVIDVVRPDAPPPPLPTQPLIYPLQCGITLA